MVPGTWVERTRAQLRASDSRKLLGLFANEAGTDLQFTVDWTSGQHTGAATPITAEGPGAARLGRVQQNTAVHDAVLAAMRGR